MKNKHFNRVFQCIAALVFVLGLSFLFQDSVSAATVKAPEKVTGVRILKYYNDSGRLVIDNCYSRGYNGYQAEVWAATGKNYKRVAVKINSYDEIFIKNSQLKKNKFFKVRVRAYNVDKNGKKLYGPWSDWKYFSHQPTVKKMKVTKKGIDISFNKIDGTGRYDVYVYDGKGSKFKKVGSTTKTKYTITKCNGKKLQKGKTYYVFVDATKKVGKKYYSELLNDWYKCWRIKYQAYVDAS